MSLPKEQDCRSPQESRFQNFLPPHKAYLLLASVFGLVFTFATPPFQVPDEFNHFYRAYQVSEGSPFADKSSESMGGSLPASIKEATDNIGNGVAFNPEVRISPDKLYAEFSRELDPERRALFAFSNTAHYPALVYLPQAAGILVARLLELSPVLCLIFGRIANLAFFVTMLCLAIRITPVLKWGLFLIGLLPMTVSLTASISPDAVTIGVVSFFTAFCFDLIFGKRTATAGNMFVVFACTFVLPLMKYSYLPLFLLLLLIPTDKFVRARHRWMSMGIVLLLLALSVFLSFLHFNDNFRVHRPIDGIVPDAQLGHVISHPADFLFLVCRTLIDNAAHLLKEFVGVLGWLDTVLPAAVHFLLKTGLIASIFWVDETEKPFLGILGRGVLAVALMMAVCLVFFGLYSIWAPVGADIIEGAQGRYFLPIAFGTMLLLAQLRFRVTRGAAWRQLLFPILSAGCLVTAVISVLHRYYGA